MNTHYDDQHRDSYFMDRLTNRAAESMLKGQSQITAGKQGEEPIATWKATNGIHAKWMPEDEQGILRISVGGGDNLPVPMNYLTIRGGVGECIALLEKAIAALRECPE